MFIFQDASCDIWRTATLFAYSVTQQLWIWRTLQSAPTVSTGNSPQTLFYVHTMVSLALCFPPLSLFFTVDYTVEKKNHTTVTTVIPKIGKISHLFLLRFSSFAAVAVFLTTVFLCLSRRARCGCLSSSGNTVDQLVPDSLRGLFFLPQTLQPPPEHLLPPQQR